MKKFLVLGLALLTSACAYTKHTAVRNIDVEERPLEVSVIPGEKISGEAYCNSYIFGLFGSEPDKLMYEVKYDRNSGNFAPTACQKGALYNAITKAQADTILMPKYTTEGKASFCIPGTGACLYSKVKVRVEGIRGTYGPIKEMDEEVIKERQKKEETGASFF